ncbi:MAG: RIP metalloprotease RseP [Verrucomicrobia bacterium]|nr:MAG: RIP metalloprotease RseP [Verrucomicrobiota bacterium]
MELLKYILILLEVLLVFNLLIFVHELGHFLAARWRGLKIDRFAIWFGKAIWKKKIGGIEYVLGSIPAGGYVALPQMATMEAIEGKGESSGKPLPPISPLDKIIVAVAGPLFSFLLAFVFAVVVWQVGHPVNQEDKSTVLGWVDPEGPAWKAGLRPGDKILEVDGHPVNSFLSSSQDSVKWRIITSESPTIRVKFERDHHEQQLDVTPTKLPTRTINLFGWKIPIERKPLRQIMVDCRRKAIIGLVESNSPAAKAGLKKGDEVVKLDGNSVLSPHDIFSAESAMSNGPVKPLALTVLRSGTNFTSTILPERPLPLKGDELASALRWDYANVPDFDTTDEIVHKSGLTREQLKSSTLPATSPKATPDRGDLPSLGIAWEPDSSSKLEWPKPMDQIRHGMGQITATLGAVFSRRGDIGLQQLGGPVMIGRLYFTLFQSKNGWREVLWWSVVINVNLALLNMLPFPVLDGGHIVLALLEVIRRRPVSAVVLQYVQTACAVLLIGFMLFLTFFDTNSLLHDSRQTQEIFAPRK